MRFATTCFQTPITWAPNEMFGCAQNDHLIVGFLMGTPFFQFQANLCLWQLFLKGV